MSIAMQRITIQVPRQLRAKLDVVRTQGHTMSAYIRDLLELDLKERETVGLLKTCNRKKGR